MVILFGEIYSRLAYKYWKYDFTPNELIIEKGIIWKVYKNIPYQRIQNIEISRGITARIFGFSTANIQTAGYSAPIHTRWGSVAGGGAEGNIPAVSIEDGERIRQFIMSKLGRKSGF